MRFWKGYVSSKGPAGGWAVRAEVGRGPFGWALDGFGVAVGAEG